MHVHSRATILLLICFIILIHHYAHGQGFTLRGEVLDAGTQHPLIGATIKVLGTTPLKGGSTDVNGRFEIRDIPVGRYDIEVSYVGYNPRIQNGVVITSGQATSLRVGLTENRFELAEVTVTSSERTVLNESALLSARSFQVEELGRIPGGLDDPARMARKFAGVVPNGSAGANDIRIRGNGSRAVLWRIEGIDVYNPNHFSLPGGTAGTISILSQRLLSNTDLYSGSFPADYGNALGGVFDIRFRNGNTDKRAHSIQVGLLGIDLATEGPIGKSGNTSYLANYRYSTTGLVANFINIGVAPIFQDLSFKIQHKGKNGGQWNLFGLGGISLFRFFPQLDTTVWDEIPGANGGLNDIFRTFTVGTSWQKPLSKDTYVKIMGVGTGLEVRQARWFQNRDLVTGDTTRSSYDFDGRLTVSAFINHRFNAQHTHRSGVMIHGLYSNGYMNRSAPLLPDGQFSGVMDTMRVGEGASTLLQAYTRSQFYLNEAWQLNVGLHLMYFPYTGEVSLEPRLGVRWQLHPNHALALSYGLHSQVEPLFAYVSRHPRLNSGPGLLNADLRFNKAHHLTLGWFHQINDRMRLGIEAYYQHQYNLVVGEDVPVSRVSGLDFLFETFDLNNNGVGRNYGIEASLERSFSQGYYFFANGSLFEANYTAGDGVTRPSLYNARFVTNLVGGKEWVIGKKRGKNNLLSFNLSATYSGPQRYTPLDLPASIAVGRFEYQYHNPNSSDQDPLLFLDASLVFKFNRPRSSSELTLQLNNLLNQRPVLGDLFDADNQEVDPELGLGFLPLISWRINF